MKVKTFPINYNFVSDDLIEIRALEDTLSGQYYNIPKVKIINFNSDMSEIIVARVDTLNQVDSTFCMKFIQIDPK